MKVLGLVMRLIVRIGEMCGGGVGVVEVAEDGGVLMGLPYMSV